MILKCIQFSFHCTKIHWTRNNLQIIWNLKNNAEKIQWLEQVEQETFISPISCHRECQMDKLLYYHSVLRVKTQQECLRAVMKLCSNSLFQTDNNPCITILFLCSQPCDDLVTTGLYQSCWDNIVTSLIFPPSLLQVFKII